MALVRKQWVAECLAAGPPRSMGMGYARGGDEFRMLTEEILFLEFHKAMD